MKTLNLVGEPHWTTPSGTEMPRPFPEIDARSQRCSTERMASLLRYKESLLREVYHRVGNSLQIIASMLAVDARKVHSDEARLHLENAQRRIMAVAAAQKQLQTSREGSDFELATYLRQLCENLTASVVGDTRRLAIDVHADAVTVPSAVAINMGLIVTELVINAIKHAFTADGGTGKIMVTYRVEGRGWRLTVSDNGVGKPNGDWNPATTGSGTGIMAALVTQLDGRIEASVGLNGLGTSVSITSAGILLANLEAENTVGKVEGRMGMQSAE